MLQDENLITYNICFKADLLYMYVVYFRLECTSYLTFCGADTFLLGVPTHFTPRHRLVPLDYTNILSGYVIYLRFLRNLIILIINGITVNDMRYDHGEPNS